MNNKTEIPDRVRFDDQMYQRFKNLRWLLNIKSTSWVTSWHFWVILVCYAALAYIYYRILPDFHDVYIILFFYPLIYASVVFRVRGVIISGLVLLALLLPYTLTPSYDPEAFARALVYSLFIILISALCAALLNHMEHQLEAYEYILSINEELNTSLERLRSTQQQLVQVAKLGAIGELSASVAHELNNPLAGVLVYTKLLKKKIESGDFEKSAAVSYLGEIESAINYCSDIIRGLLDFARQSAPVMRPITVARAIDKAISLAGHQARNKNIEIIREDPSSLPLVTGDFNQILQVLVNLMVNAVQATGEGGRLTIHTSTDGEKWVRIALRDTGCGISAENLDKLFTPFFTTKQDVKGVGLGLAVSHGIVERHGGRIEVESREGEGSTFTVYLPIAGK